eukprot:GHVU01180873.1.p1 GENE.GHVU01180873.1~~GHVU01180873.1.p1  ORF type:complete len:146 (+),score=28.33 GHVU01180873.1:275-712(+)
MAEIYVLVHNFERNNVDFHDPSLLHGIKMPENMPSRGNSHKGFQAYTLDPRLALPQKIEACPFLGGKEENMYFIRNSGGIERGRGEGSEWKKRGKRRRKEKKIMDKNWRKEEENGYGKEDDHRERSKQEEKPRTRRMNWRGRVLL